MANIDLEKHELTRDNIVEGYKCKNSTNNPSKPVNRHVE